MGDKGVSQRRRDTQYKQHPQQLLNAKKQQQHRRGPMLARRVRRRRGVGRGTRERRSPGEGGRQQQGERPELKPVPYVVDDLRHQLLDRVPNELEKYAID